MALQKFCSNHLQKFKTTTSSRNTAIAKWWTTLLMASLMTDAPVTTTWRLFWSKDHSLITSLNSAASESAVWPVGTCFTARHLCCELNPSSNQCTSTLMYIRFLQQVSKQFCKIRKNNISFNYTHLLWISMHIICTKRSLPSECILQPFQTFAFAVHISHLNLRWKVSIHQSVSAFSKVHFSILLDWRQEGHPDSRKPCSTLQNPANSKVSAGRNKTW